MVCIIKGVFSTGGAIFHWWRFFHHDIVQCKHCTCIFFSVAREFRSLVIDMVLATDMSYHFQQIKNMKNLLSMPEKWVDKSQTGEIKKNN